MPLDGYRSLCEKNAKRIVSRDPGNSQQHIGLNPTEVHVTHYKIDGNVIRHKRACDFLLLNERNNIAYFIELKGSDLCKAAEQIEATEIALSSKLAVYSKRYRIIANKCRTQAIESASFKKYKLRWKTALIYRSSEYSETI